MLTEANRLIREAVAEDAEERQRRAEARAALTQAEELSAELEEILLVGEPVIPRPLARRIRAFVAEHGRQFLRRLGKPMATMDALFDLQEWLQNPPARSAEPSLDHQAA